MSLEDGDTLGSTPTPAPKRPAGLMESPSTYRPSLSLARSAFANSLVWLQQRLSRLIRRNASRPPSSSERRRLIRRLTPWIVGFLLIALALGIAGASIEVGATISDLRVAIPAGQAHLSRAEQLGTQLSASPLDQNILSQLRNEVAEAELDFRQAQHDVLRLGPGSIVPGVGVKVSDALALLEMAVALTSGGRTVLDAAAPVVDGLRSALAPPASTGTPSPGTPSPQATPQPGPALTTVQLTNLRQAIHLCMHDLDQAATARSRIHDNGAGLDASVAHLLARYDAVAPSAHSLLQTIDALATAAPSLLGTDHPANYLVEILDETELRGGGGFMGNYGIVTVSGGRVGSANVRDTYLLDGPYLAGHTRPFPPNYAWFRLAPTMGLRDSNLAPDFAYNAQLAEQILTEEGGQSVQGVLAITPALIARLLKITGPVLVPGYNVTVNSQNLVELIHYYQFLKGDQGVPSSDGVSSVRKHFTAVLGEAVFARVRSLPQSQLHNFMTLASDGLKAKDLQLYVNDAGAEAVLTGAKLANTLTPPKDAAPTDQLAFLDNNIGGNKAFLYLTQSVSDEITAQADGTSRHSLTVQYSYHPTGDVHGSTTFADEIQIFVPTGSTLVSRSGLDAVDAAGTAYGRAVFGGRIYLAPFSKRTVTLSWTAPTPGGATSGMRSYRLIVTRQAGSICSFAIGIRPPGLTSSAKAAAPLTLNGGRASYATAGPLGSDLDLQVQWK
jgi:hypothetical protein